MNIIISNASDKPIYEQISSQIKAQIMNGQLQEGELLPSIRVIAKELKVSVITTKRAYADLERDGFIEVVQGKGSFVASRNMDFIREEQLKNIEALLQKSVDMAKMSDISLEELMEMLSLSYKGEDQ
ncbi:GntR family transcriptional regulator [Solibacillus sp. FSL H8-0523]|uniref:GntR family transcriptional regulator n=1 Tax=Solibacillus sp. FSL H8-0523 TaxID=2954511 RepID=UPI003101827C